MDAVVDVVVVKDVVEGVEVIISVLIVKKKATFGIGATSCMAIRTKQLMLLNLLKALSQSLNMKLLSPAMSIRSICS